MGTADAVPVAVEQHPGLRSAWRRLYQADAEFVGRRGDYFWRRHLERTPRLHPRRQGGEGPHSIRNMLSAESRTVRGGETRVIAAEQLVPGDIVCESGDKVPADLRLVDVKNFRTEEAALTGELCPPTSQPVRLPQTRRSGTAKTWRSPEPWSCRVGRQASWWRREAKQSSAASINCWRASAPLRLRSYAKSKSSAMRSPRSLR